MANYDAYPRLVSGDPGLVNTAKGAVPSTGLQPGVIVNYRVPFTAGAGTSADIQVTIGAKARLIDACVQTTTAVASSVLQVFTAASGGGTACTSSISTGSTGRARDSLTTATQVFAAGSIAYVHLSGGATLAGGEANLVFQLEQ